MQHDIEIHVGRDAIRRLLAFCATLPTQQFVLVSDTNTYGALGERIERALEDAGYPVRNIVLTGDEVIADEKYLVRVLVQAPPGDQVYVAIGSGTITDITRYVSYRTRNPFISTPTAASVDGFLSTGAPLVVGGVKDTIFSQGPIAMFADIETLIDAPRPLRAAGFGDIIGKTTSLADWRLGDLFWNEPYSAAIEQRVQRTIATCMDAVEDIAAGTEQGVRSLIDGLTETGLCMLEVGNSRPASGSEHHCSHYWEMQLLQRGKPAILHGAKVGFATTLIARLYEQIRNLSQDDVAALVKDAPFVGRDAAIAEIRQGYGPLADDIIRIQEPFLALTPDDDAQLKQRITANWPAVQEIARAVLPPATITAALDRVGAPTSWQALGLSEDIVAPALRYGHYLRNRFTVVKLMRVLGMPVRM